MAATTGGQLTAHEADASLLVDRVLPVVGDVTGRTWHGLIVRVAGCGLPLAFESADYLPKQRLTRTRAESAGRPP